MAEASRSRRRPPTTESRRVSVPQDDPLAHVEPWTGRPQWIGTVPGARWARCQTFVTLPDRTVRGAPRHAPWLFPRLLDREDGAFKEPTEPAHHGYGRPRRVDANPSLLLYVAWRRDIAGSTQREVAEALYGGPTAHIGSTEIKRVRDAERDGRALYRNRGTLPWAAYADGKPAARWWTDPAFGEGVRLWQLQTVAEPSDEPQPDPALAMREALDRMAGPLLAKTVQKLVASFPTKTNIAFSIDREKLAQLTLRSHGIEPWEYPGPGDPADG